jgi:putative PIN family toxin of toxin-antitoxin system
MRIVLDTNVLISALLKQESIAADILSLWRENKYQLISCRQQLDEFRQTSRYEKIRRYIVSSRAGAMYNELAAEAIHVQNLPAVDLSADPKDNFILAMAVAGKADYLVTGDKRDLLALGQIEQTKIITLSEMLKILSH